MTSDPLVAEVVQRMSSVLPAAGRPHALHEPQFGDLERQYVLDCLDSGWVSSAGEYVGRFERELAERCGSAGAVACANGTVALQVALRIVGVQAGDEVLMPSMTFVGTANAAVALGAVPHFVDVDEVSMGSDPEAARQHLRAITTDDGGVLRNRSTGRRIAAAVLVHVFGQPAMAPEWVELAAEIGIPLVEDAAEALGSTLGGRHAGTFGRIGVLSFNGNKVLTTGGGGALVSRDAELTQRAHHLTTTAKVPHAWEFVHDEFAYNFRMPNINAALGCAQLAGLDEALRRKRTLADSYAAAFAGLDGADVVRERPGACANNWLNTLVLDEDRSAARDAILTETNAAGMQTRPVWRPMHQLPMYSDCPRAELPRTDSLARRLISMPSSPQLVEA